VLNPEPESAREAKKKLTDTPSGQAVFVMLWMFGTLVTVAALVGAFFLGRIVQAPDEPLLVEVTEEADDSPGVVDLSGGPRPEGEWLWHELVGGECIAGFEGAFAETFRVVSCSLPHDAELVVAQLLQGNLRNEFPGEETVQAQARAICQIDDRINFEAAQNYSDLVIDYSYPVTAQTWSEGYQAAYCFVTRSSGGVISERLTG
jgi:hypothetical protein